MKLLLQVLSASKPGNHNPCAFCSDKSALSIFVRRENQTAGYRCHKCEAKGDIFSALKNLSGLEFKDAIAYLKGTPNIKITPAKHAEYVKQSEARTIPVIDQDKAEKLISYANKFLLDHMEYSAEYNRGLSREVVEKYRIGFLFNERWRIYDYGNPHLFNATWIIPITDEDGKINGIKFHHQIQPLNGKGEEFKGKCSWAPFGTDPVANFEKGIQPVHSYYTLWPHPDTLTEFDSEFSIDPAWWINQIDPKTDLYDRWYSAMYAEQASIAYALGVKIEQLSTTNMGQALQNAYSTMGREIRKAVQLQRGKIVQRNEVVDPENPTPDFDSYIFITPGELKALALIGEGYKATSVTGGESWTPHRSLLESLRGQRVCLFWDDDLPQKPEGRKYWMCAGRTWAAKMTTALIGARVKEIISINGGRTVLGTKPVKEKSDGAEEKEEPFEI
jgi:hypothetical protein